MQPVEIIAALQATTKRLEKDAILEKAWHAGVIEFFEGAQLAYDGFVVFNVAAKMVPKIEEEGNTEEFVPSDTWEDFKSLATDLQKRKLTGNAAKEAINKFALKSDARRWNNWYRQILLKDLRIGASESTLKKVLQKLSKELNDKRPLKYIPREFAIHLAKPAQPKHFSGEKYIDAKYDGVRMFTTINIDTNEVTMFSRNGKVNTNCHFIIDNLKTLMPHLPGSICLDGEVSGIPFQKVMKAISSKTIDDEIKSLVQQLEYVVFDVITLEDFKNGESVLTQEERHEVLQNMIPLFEEFCPMPNVEGKSNITVLPKLLVDFDTEEGKKLYEDFVQEVKERDLEGTMIKCPKSKWKTKRTDGWLKWKPFVDVTLKVIDIEEGTVDKGRAGRLGAIVCSGTDVDPSDGKTKELRVNVSSGFKDDELDEIWSNKNLYIGRLAEIRADVFTRNQNDENMWSLRFPRFKGWRDIDGEKV